MKAKYFFSLAVISFLLRGCIPLYQYDTQKGSTKTLILLGNDLQLNIYSPTALLDSKKMIITLGLMFNNKSEDAINLSLSSMGMFSGSDSFVTRNYEGKLINPFFNEKDTLVVAPWENEQRFHIYFFSRRNYSGKAFRKTYHRDTLFLKLSIPHKVDTVLAFTKHIKKNES